MDFETYYAETFEIFEELQSKKLLRKLPDNISCKIARIIEKYQKRDDDVEYQYATSTLASYDTRFNCDDDPPEMELESMIDEPWWSGVVEFKGLLKGGKGLKGTAFCYDNKICIFQGSKKKLLKGQLIIGKSTNVELGRMKDGKKSSLASCFISQSYTTEVQMKFSSPEDASKWYDLYRVTSQIIRSYSVKSCDPSVRGRVPAEYTTGEITRPSTSESSDSLKCFVSNAVQANFERDEHGRPVVSTLQREKRESTISCGHSSINDSLKDTNSLTSDDLPMSWKEIELKYTAVFQAAWDFNTSGNLLDLDCILSLSRGELFLLQEQVNNDWWKGLDEGGKQGFVPRTYLTAAFEEL